MEKETKEFKNMMSAIDKWVKKHDGRVNFVADFIAFDKKIDIIEDRIIAYGPKECIKLSMKEINGYLKEEKEDFCNW